MLWAGRRSTANGRPSGSPSVAGQFDRRCADRFPELAEAIHALGFGRARDDGGVQRADRDTRHPVRPDAGFVQALIDAGLVGAERAAALQHQSNDVVLRHFNPTGRTDQFFPLQSTHLPHPPGISAEVVMHDGAEAERQVGDQMLGPQHLQHRQLGDRRRARAGRAARRPGRSMRLSPSRPRGSTAPARRSAGCHRHAG